MTDLAGGALSAAWTRGFAKLVSDPNNFGLVIPDVQFVIPDSIRDPVPRHHWIAGQARNDEPAAGNDEPAARNDKTM